MFYADFVLSKKGPLARIWLAAHWDKKLTKAQIFETNIESSIERILRPKVKLALRTSGHLMLGVVRIYSRKTKYLLADCNEAFVKIKMAFRPGMVDLPEDHREAAVNAVTLPEVFHDFDTAMPDLNDIDIEAQFTLNQSRADEITMREDYGNVPTFNNDDGFGTSFDTNSSNIPRSASGGFDQCLEEVNLLLFNDNMNVMDKNKDRPSTSDVSAGNLVNMSADVDMAMDVEMAHLGAGDGYFEGRLFEDAAPIPEVQRVDSDHPIQEAVPADGAVPSTSKRMSPEAPPLETFGGPTPMNDDDDFGDHYFPSPGGGSSDGSRPVSPIPAAGGTTPSIAGAIDQFLASTDLPESSPPPADVPPAAEPEVDQNVEVAESNENQNAEQTTLLQNEEESFALAPVDASALRGLPKTKRKRKLIVDEVKNISGEEMKAQLSDTSDIVITLDLAPPTKRLMHWKETGGVEKLFALPGKNIPSTALFKNYQRHLTSRAAPNDEGVEDKDLDALRDANQDGLELNTPQIAPVPTRRGRKRKQAVVEEEPEPFVEPVQEVTKKTRMSPKAAEEQHLPTIPEESVPESTEPSLAQNAVPHDLEVPQPEPAMADLPADIQSASMLVDQPNDILPPASVPPQSTPPVTTEDNNVTVAPEPVVAASPAPVPPPPYTEQNIAEQLEPQPQEQLPVEIASSQESSAPALPEPLFSSFTENNVEPSFHQDNQTFDANLNATADKESMMANMGYDGHGPEVPIQDAAAPGLFNFNEDNDHNPITPGINAGGITPWHDADYDNPASIGPPEERGDNETVEQFEERLLNKRAGHLYSSIRMRIATNSTTIFSDLIIQNNKKQVAQKFYSLLVLKKHRVLELTQEEPYGAILLTKGPNFDDPKL